MYCDGRPSHHASFRRRSTAAFGAAWVTVSLISLAGAGAPAVRAQTPAKPSPTTRRVGFGRVVRPRQWPLKTARTLWTDAEIAQARRNVQRHAQARKVRDACVRAADRVCRWSDRQLRARIPTSEVPRAFNVGTAGCPVHGKEIYAKGGTYPWRTDPNRPFQIQCPIGREWYPSNDFYAYFLSDMQDRSLLTGPYADDGWGWVGPDGHRYWFVAYACHSAEWRRFVLGGLTTLYQAYLLTGDRRYAHKAAVILVRIAQTYPAMDYCQQSRFSKLGRRDYHGKILNHIWETGVYRELARAYDAIWETIDDDRVLARLYGYESGEEIRSLIESNLLEDGIDAIFAKKIRGNFGMHQQTLAIAAAVRQTGPVREWCDGILTDAMSSSGSLGLNYALYNLVYRDGMPSETSPSYCFGWTRDLYAMADALSKTGINLFELPKLRSLANAPLEMICIDKYTPSLGDSGTVWGTLIPTRASVYQAAYRAYGDPRYARWLERIGAAGENTFKTFESLLHPPIELKASGRAPTPRSCLMDGYGMALLRNAANTMGVSLYYGIRGGHGHFDRLHFDLYANGVPMMPDLGYPDFMNSRVPGIASWSKNTISHNTVAVDKTRQSGNDPGVVRHFAAVEGFQAVDVDAPTTYAGLDMYRRCLMQIETGRDDGYLVDVFRVRGGDHHVYGLHGPPGRFRVVRGGFSAPARGTLAGPDVPVGALYDDPVRGKPGFKGSYYDYTGSGYSHFVNVQRQLGGSFVGQWSHAKASEARLQIHVLLQPGQELLLADAQVSPIKYRDLVKYVLVRRAGRGLADTFVSVIEPFRIRPAVRAVKQLDVSAPAVAVEVDRGQDREVIVQQPDPTRMVQVGQAIRTDAAMTVVRYDAAGRVRKVVAVGGRDVRVGDRHIVPKRIAGRIARVEPKGRCVVVRFDDDRAPTDPGRLAGRAVCFIHDRRRAWHPVVRAEAADGGVRLLLGDDLLIGRFRVLKVEGKTIRARSTTAFKSIYAGSHATDESCEGFTPVLTFGSGRITLARPMQPAPKPGRDIWLCDAGPGDVAAFEAVYSGELGEGR